MQYLIGIFIRFILIILLLKKIIYFKIHFFIKIILYFKNQYYFIIIDSYTDSPTVYFTGI